MTEPPAVYQPRVCRPRRVRWSLDGRVLAASGQFNRNNRYLVRRWSEGPEQHAQFWLSDGSAFEEGWSGITGNHCVAQR